MRSMPLKVLLLAGTNKGRVPARPCRATWRSSVLIKEQRSEGKVYLRAFMVVSMERNGQGRVDKFEQALD